MVLYKGGKRALLSFCTQENKMLSLRPHHRVTLNPPPPTKNFNTPQEICKLLKRESKNKTHPIFKLIHLAISKKYVPVSLKNLHAVFENYRDTNDQCREIWAHFSRLKFLSTEKLTSVSTNYFKMCFGKGLSREHIKELCKREGEEMQEREGLLTINVSSSFKKN